MLDLSLLENKTITILGAGITGLSCARFLMKHQIPFSLNDSRENVISNEEFEVLFAENILSTGAWDQHLISQADILLVSPGIDLTIPDIAQAINPEGLVFGDVELFCRLTDIPTIAVTGSNGKSTVVSLLAYLGEQLGFDTQLGGNIGVPVLDTIEQHPDYLILELSSFQLETMTNMQALSASVLNLCEDHLDRHKTLENYQAIKADIYRQADVAVINRDDKRTHLPTLLSGKKTLSFGLDTVDQQFGLVQENENTWLAFGEQKLIKTTALPLAGLHNALNCLAALALGYAAGWSLEKMASALSGFTGLAHRCQTIESSDGVHWINDSKATNVGATIAAIDGFAKQIQANNQIYLIAGGDAKGADLSILAPYLSAHVAGIYTFGKDGKQIVKLSKKTQQVANLNEAVQQASIVAKQGDVVLLSPACASIDMFKNYIERGLAFEKAVREVQAC